MATGLPEGLSPLLTALEGVICYVHSAVIVFILRSNVGARGDVVSRSQTFRHRALIDRGPVTTGAATRDSRGELSFEGDIFVLRNNLSLRILEGTNSSKISTKHFTYPLVQLQDVVCGYRFSCLIARKHFFNCGVLPVKYVGI